MLNRESQVLQQIPRNPFLSYRKHPACAFRLHDKRVVAPKHKRHFAGAAILGCIGCRFDS